MDLHALAVVALVLLSGEDPARLLDPVTMAWRWPAALTAEPALQAQISRLLERQPGERFASASQALAAFQAIPMPESTGPVPRADRTVALVPPPPPAPPAPAEPVSEPPQPPPPALRSRLEEREEVAEGGVWPVVIALVLSAVVGTALGWWWLSRGRLTLPTP
jgi:serine/threonine-protein kinase